MSKDVVRTGYDAIASEYAADRRIGPREVAFLKEFMDYLQPDAQVLDAGCGAGAPVAELLSRRFGVTGVDISETQIGLARQLVPQATFLRADMTELAFPDETFDAICSLYAIIHIPRDEHRALFRDFRRMLKPKGIALLCLGTQDWPGEVETFFGAPMYWSHYDAETNLAMLEETGFRVLRFELVPDGLDPEMGAKHLFVLIEKG